MVDKVLAENIKAAKQGKARNFAMAVKGNDIALYLSKKKVPAPMGKELKQRIGATLLIEGVCVEDSTGFVFKTLGKAPSIASHLKAYIAAESGVTVAPRIETVATLDDVDEGEDSPDLSKVTGGKSGIDVNARAEKEMLAQVQTTRDFVNEAGPKKVEFEKVLAAANTSRKECTAQKMTAQKELRVAKAEQPLDQTKVDAITKDIATLTKNSDALGKEWSDARAKVEEVTKLTKAYSDMLVEFDSLTDFAKKYELMQHGRQKAIDAVREKINKVYAETGRKLVILGRTADTFEGDTSWVSKHPKEGARVLQEDDWSMAVNDAFIKSGLDQKAEFAMISKFKDQVLAKIKDLLKDPGSRTPEDLKKELRAFAKQEGDKALFTGGAYNEGFAVSMIELEQLIDDGYVMMEHDTGAQDVKKLKDLKPTPVMVPSGKGQKIKDELAAAVDTRDKRLVEQKKRINAEFVDILKVSNTKIKDSKQALGVVRSIKVAMDENRWDDADTSLGELKGVLA